VARFQTIAINISEQEEGVDLERQIPVDHTGVQAGSGRGTPRGFTSDLSQFVMLGRTWI